MDLELEGEAKITAEDGTVTDNPFFSKELWASL